MTEASDEHRAEVSPKYAVTLAGGTVGAIGENAQVTITQLSPRREVIWPVVVGSAPLLASAYRDRPTLHAQVATHNTVVLSGAGGAGKTQLAASVFSKSAADLRVWVPAGSRTSVITGFADAAVRLDLGDPGDDPEHLARLFTNSLVTSSRSWLVVLDDVWDPADVDALWPSGGGIVVATTRRRDAALSGGGRHVVDVGMFTAEEARAYLADRLSTALPMLPPGVLDESAGLAEDLGRLPLGLSQAAAVIIDEAISCATYRTWFADRTTRLEVLFPPTATADGYDRTVATTWTLAVETADRLEPLDMARPMVKLLSVFDPAGAPESVFTNDCACEVLAVASGRGTVLSQDARKALRVLDRFSLISHNPNDEPRSVRMHRLTGRAIREQIPKELLSGLVAAAADCLSNAWPEVENHPPLAEALRANAVVLNDTEPSAMWDPAAGGHRVLQHVGDSLLAAGLVGSAVAYGEVLSAQAQMRLGRDHPDAIAIRRYLARACREAGDYTRALPLFEQDVVDVTRVLGPDDPQILEARNGLAGVCIDAGDLNRAITTYEQSLADAQRILGPTHPHTVTMKGNLGNALREAGEPRRGVSMLERAAADLERIHGADHPHTLNARNSLAGACLYAGSVSRAIRLLEQNLKDRERLLGSDHPDTLMSRDNLAGAHLKAGDLARAIALSERCVVDYERLLSPEHPDTLVSRLNLAGAHLEAGHLESATSMLNQILDDSEHILGPNHSFTARVRGILSESNRRLRGHSRPR